MLQKYDLERDETRDRMRAEFDLERDEVLRKFIASIMGVKLQDSPRKTRASPANGQKQTMTAEDIMRSYSK